MSHATRSFKIHSLLRRGSVIATSAMLALLLPYAALAQPAGTVPPPESRLEQRNLEVQRNRRLHATPEQERAAAERAAERIRASESDRVERGFVANPTAAEHRRETNARRSARATREASQVDRQATLSGLERASADRAEQRARGSETRRAAAASSDEATEDARAMLMERIESHRD